jgi:hypothetical protein
MRRWLGAVLFGLASLSFALPFANIHQLGSDSAESGADLVRFRGYELVIGKPFPESFDQFVRDLVIGQPDDFHFASEPFAVVTALAALAGLGLSLRRTPRGRQDAVWPALVGAVAMLLLGLSPLMRLLGLLRVTYQPGYWLAFVFLIAAGITSFARVRSAVGVDDGVVGRPGAP